MSKELRKLVETIVAEELGAEQPPMGPVFEPREPVTVVKGTGEYIIAREFAIKLTPELAAMMQLRPYEADEAQKNNGVLDNEWELVIDIDASYSPGTPARLHGHPDTWHPADPEDFEIGDWHVEGILRYGIKSTIVFGPEDTKRLQAMLGELTEREIDSIREQYMENLPEPDYDDRDY